MTQATTTITMDDGEVGDDLRLKMGPVQLLDDFSAGVNPSGSLPVADVNVARKNAASSDHNFLDLARHIRTELMLLLSSHDVRRTLSRTRSPTKLKTRSIFRYGENLFNFRKQMVLPVAWEILISDDTRAALVKLQVVKIFAALCIFTPKIRRRRLKFTNSFTRTAALTALPLTNLHLRTQRCAPTFVSRKLILRGVQNGLIIIFPLQRGRILDLSLLLLQRNPVSRIYLRLRCIVLQHFGNLVGTLTLRRLWTQT